MKKLNRFFLVYLLLAGMIFLTLSACQRQAAETKIKVSFFCNLDEIVFEAIEGIPGENTGMDIPQKKGFRFEGFFLDENHSVLYSETLPAFPQADMSLYAKYQALSLHRIQFNTGGGSYVESITAYSGDPLSQFASAFKVPIKAGHLFIGWSVSDQADYFFDFQTEVMPAKDLVLYARWASDPQTCTATYIALDKIVGQIVVPLNSIPAPPSYSPAPGQELEGWYVDVSQPQKFDFLREEISSDTVFYANLYTKGLLFEQERVVGCYTDPAEIVIPWAYQGYRIKSIGNSAFRGKFFAKATLSGSIEAIGENAFFGCGELVSVNIPDPVVRIGKGAFAGTAIREISLPDTVADIQLGEVFYNCDQLTSITFSKDHPLFATHEGSVYSKDLLSLVLLAPGLSYGVVRAGTRIINENAIFGAVQTLIFPDSVRVIRRGALADCPMLVRLVLPAVDNVASSLIEQDAPGQGSFNLAAIFGAEHYLDNITLSGAMRQYSSFVPHTLREVEILSVTQGCDLSYAFYGCAYLEKIILPQTGLVAVGANAFAYCMQLRRITVPDSVLSIYGGDSDAAFYGCTGLQEYSAPFIGGSYRENRFLTYVFGGESYKSLYADGIELPLDKVVITGQDCYSLSAGAFYGLSALRVVDLPQGIEELGYDIFYGCHSLRSVSRLSGAVRMLTDAEGYSGAFANCYSLADLRLPKITGVIGDDAFVRLGADSGLTDAMFVVPEGITEIGNDAFYGCTGIERFSLPSTLGRIGNNAFSQCTALKSLEIPAGCKMVGAMLLEGCSSLQVIAIPLLENVYLQDNSRAIFSLPVLFGASSYTKNRKDDGGSFVPASLNTVIFNQCLSPEALYYSFYACNFLETVELHEDTEVIGAQAFFRCAALRSLLVPNNVRDIADSAFGFCNAMQFFSVSFLNADFLEREGVLFDRNETVLIAYPNGQNVQQYIVPETVTEIKPYAFSGNAVIKEIFLPESLSKLGHSVFAECPNLVSIFFSGEQSFFYAEDAIYESSARTILYAYIGREKRFEIPDSVTEIGPYAFDSAHSLEQIGIGECVEKIGEYAFSHISAQLSFGSSSALRQIGTWSFAYYAGNALSLPDTVETIAEYAFAYADLQELAFSVSSRLGHIGAQAFYGCRFQAIRIPASVTRIDAQAFAKNIHLERVAFLEGNTALSIGREAFYGCGIQEITFPPSICYIGAHAFDSNAIRRLDLSGAASLLEVGDYAFASNFYLTDLMLPAELQMGEGAFYDNRSLRALRIPEGVEQIGDYAFAISGQEGSLGSLTEVLLPASLETIGSYAFYGAGGQDLGEGFMVTLAQNSRLREIGAYAFCNASFARTQLNFTDSMLEKIGEYAFRNGRNGGFLQINLPDSLTHIGEGAFWGHNQLHNLSIPDQVRHIGSYAFFECNTLSNVQFGDAKRGSQLVYVGEKAFFGMENLILLLFAEAPPVFAPQAFASHSILFVPFGSFECYRDALASQGAAYDLKIIGANASVPVPAEANG